MAESYENNSELVIIEERFCIAEIEVESTSKDTVEITSKGTVESTSKGTVESTSKGTVENTSKGKTGGTREGKTGGSHEGKGNGSRKGKSKGSSDFDTCQCFDDDDAPALGDYIPGDCKGDVCIETGCNNFRETKACCWCPLKYYSFSLDHCIVATSNGEVCDCGEIAKKRSKEIDNKLKKNDLCCRDHTFLGLLACPFTIAGCALGCVGGILNVFCSLTCCITGCCCWFCENCDKNKVASA